MDGSEAIGGGAKRSDHPGAMTRIVRTAGNLVLFGAALVLSCYLINEHLPIPAVSMVQAKLERLKERSDDYDTLFLGSSRIYHQIIPQLFDRLTSERAIATKSFNAAVDGMRPPEDAYYFDQILKFRPKHLRWVFIELGAIRVPVDPKKRGTNRLVYWHDWERLALIFREAVSVKKSRHWYGTLKSLQEPMSDFSEHLGLYLENMSNIGRASELVAQVAYPTRPRVWWPPLGPAEDGFLEIDRHTMSDNDRNNFGRMMAARRQRPAEKDYGSEASQDALRRMVRKIESLGATPIMIIPPTTAAKNFYPLPSNDDGPLVLDFSDIGKYPALYEEQYRLDTEHQNTAGAELCTRLVVERYAELAEERHK